MAAKKKSGQAIAISKEYKQLVDNAMREMDVMEKNLVKAGLDKEEAKLRVQQIYFNNLQTFSEPENAAIALLAELKTRIDIDRIKNPEDDLLSERYLKLTEEMRKTIDLVRKTKPATISHRVQSVDDRSMKFGEFIDVEDDE